MRIEVIGQRLLTGRLAIAQAALVSTQVVHQHALAYGRTKEVHVLGGKAALAELPHLQAHFSRAGTAMAGMEAATAEVEARLAVCLRSGAIPGDALVQDIGICKIKVRWYGYGFLQSPVRAYSIDAGVSAFGQVEF